MNKHRRRQSLEDGNATLKSSSVHADLPNNSRFRHSFQSRTLQRFPFLLEIFYWDLTYWVSSLSLSQYGYLQLTTSSHIRLLVLSPPLSYLRHRTVSLFTKSPNIMHCLSSRLKRRWAWLLNNLFRRSSSASYHTHSLSWHWSVSEPVV